jgi:hypothetical protein
MYIIAFATVQLTTPARAEWMKGAFLEHITRAESLNQIFSVKNEAGAPQPPAECRAVTDANRGLLGLRDWQSGAPLTRMPELAFWDWQQKCIRAYLTRVAEPESISLILGPKLAAWLKAKEKTMQTAKWFDLPFDIRDEVYLSCLDRAIGLGVLTEFKREPAKVVNEVFLPRLEKIVTKDTPVLDVAFTLYVVALSLDEALLE